MVLPNDWDHPSKRNPQLCSLFTRETFHTKGIHLPFRMFAPHNAAGASGKRLPLILFLHGADAVGTDNAAPLAMHDVGTMFARDYLQRAHPCYILAPQYGRGQHWSIPEVGDAVLALLRSVVGRLNADPDRLYVYGYSAGGVGVFRLVKENPGLFAAAVSVCGATSREQLEQLPRTPLWMIHAADDEIVKDSYAQPGSRPFHLGSQDICQVFSRLTQKIPPHNDGMPAYTPALFPAEKPLIYTQLAPGWMKRTYQANPHCSWLVLSDPRNAIFSDWLFRHHNRS